MISPKMLHKDADLKTGCFLLLHQHKDVIIVFLNSRNSVTYQPQYGLTIEIVVGIAQIKPSSV